MLRYAISNRTLFRGDEAGRRRELLAWASGVGSAGVNFLQLREKDLAEHDLERLARDLADTLRQVPNSIRLLVNGPAQLAAAAGADGVHLPGGSGAAELRRAAEIFEAAGLRRPVVSVSCHSLHDVRQAREAGASMALFAPVFEKRVDGEVAVEGVGLDRLREACEAAGEMPVLALGGVNWANAGLCLGAGAAGVAGIRMFLGPAAAPRV